MNGRRIRSWRGCVPFSVHSRTVCAHSTWFVFSCILCLVNVRELLPLSLSDLLITSSVEIPLELPHLHIWLEKSMASVHVCVGGRRSAPQSKSCTVDFADLESQLGNCVGSKLWQPRVSAMTPREPNTEREPKIVWAIRLILSSCCVNRFQ